MYSNKSFFIFNPSYNSLENGDALNCDLRTGLKSFSELDYSDLIMIIHEFTYEYT